MAETDCRSSHVVVDIAEGEDEEKEAICVVCMEPMEWAAVFPCGHREVCVRCAATIRFYHRDFRCCICRRHCSTVVVRPYFDDVHQYQEEMNKVCTTSSQSPEGSRVNANLNAVSVSPIQAAGAPLEEPSSSSSEDVGTSLVLVAVVLSLLAIGGFLMIGRHPYPKILIVVPVSVLLPAFTACTIYAWRKFSNNSLQWGWMN